MGSGGSKSKSNAASTPGQSITASPPPASLQQNQPTAAAPSAPNALAEESEPLAPISDISEFEKGVAVGEQNVLERAQAAVDRVSSAAKLEVRRAKDEDAAAERAALQRWLNIVNKEMYRAPQRPLSCQPQRLNLLACYDANPKNPVPCGTFVQAFEECSRRAVDSLMKPTV